MSTPNFQLSPVTFLKVNPKLQAVFIQETLHIYYLQDTMQGTGMNILLFRREESIIWRLQKIVIAYLYSNHKNVFKTDFLSVSQNTCAGV